MYKDVLKSMPDSTVFTIIGLIIFVIFFAGLLFYTFGLNKKLIKDMSDLPLQDDNPTNEQ